MDAFGWAMAGLVAVAVVVVACGFLLLIEWMVLREPTCRKDE